MEGKSTVKSVSTLDKDVKAGAEPSCPLFLTVSLSSTISVLCKLSAVETYVHWAEKSRELGMAVQVQEDIPFAATRMRAER